MTATTTPTPEPEALRSVFMSSLADIFAQLNRSLVVSTYQAGKVILVRYDASVASANGHSGTINTHVSSLLRPMGIAVQGRRLAIGSQSHVWELHDACSLPRRIHITGDIDIPALADAGDGALRLVNTRFGCLWTLDAACSCRPRWRPPFLSAYAPDDCCHRNGLTLVDGRPGYVTALGATDTPGGGRVNTASGGILIDVETNEIVLRGFSMPHAPRWYGARLWLLESGQGGLGRSGNTEVAHRLPAARLHPRDRLLRAAGLHRTVAGARDGHLRRHPAGGAPERAHLRGLGRQHPDRRDAGLPALRGGCAGDLRRPGACEHPLPGDPGVGQRTRRSCLRPARRRAGGDAAG